MQTKEKESKVPVIVVAGANGELGQRIVAELISLGVRPKALVRAGSSSTLSAGAEIISVDYNDEEGLTNACSGAHCVVSALSGLADVIVDAQMALLTAAVNGGVKKFIPSDYSIDYTKLPDGSNRNLDLRRNFQRKLDAAPIAATSILNGMFTDLLLKEAPLIQFGLSRVLYWGTTPRLHNSGRYSRLYGEGSRRREHTQVSANCRRHGQ